MSSPFITFREKDKNENLQYYILQRHWPHYVGLIAGQPSESTLAQAPISGYNLYVIFAGTLQGNMIPGYNNVDKEIQSVFFNMASWYYTNRILTDEKRFKKFKINVSSTI